MNIHLPTRPNIQLALTEFRLTYILFIIASIICGALLIYLLRRIFSVITKTHQVHTANKHLLSDLQKKYKEELHALEGREFVVAFLGYLERYAVHHPYAGLEDILTQIGMDKQKIEQTLLLYYSQRGDENVISSYLKQLLETIV